MAAIAAMTCIDGTVKEPAHDAGGRAFPLAAGHGAYDEERLLAGGDPFG
jgi:hypothetical protein